MKKFAIIENGKVSHIFTPLEQFGMDTNPYPDSVTVAETTGKPFVTVGSVYPFKHDKRLLNQKPNEMVSLAISITNKCNLRCGYCYNADRDTSPELKRDQWEDIVHSVGNVSELSFQGGECTLYYDDILEFAEEYIDAFPRGILIRTNGTLVKDYRSMSANLRSKLRFMYSLDGFQSYNDHRRGSGVFEQVVESIWLAREAGVVSLEATATIDIDTILSDTGEIQLFVRFLESLGIRRIILHIQQHPGEDSDRRAKRMQAYELLKGIEFASEASLVYPFLQCHKGVNVQVEANGSLCLRCAFVNLKFGHYTEFSYQGYMKILDKADQLGINCRTTDFTKITEFIQSLGYKVH